MEAETDILFSLRPFCKSNLSGDMSVSAHPAELHSDTSLRAWAKKKRFAIILWKGDSTQCKTEQKKS